MLNFHCRPASNELLAASDLPKLCIHHVAEMNLHGSMTWVRKYTHMRLHGYNDTINKLV